MGWYPEHKSQKKGATRIQVRVIEYTIETTDQPHQSAQARLITSLLELEQFPALLNRGTQYQRLAFSIINTASALTEIYWLVLCISACYITLKPYASKLESHSSCASATPRTKSMERDYNSSLCSINRLALPAFGYKPFGSKHLHSRDRERRHGRNARIRLAHRREYESEREMGNWGLDQFQYPKVVPEKLETHLYYRQVTRENPTPVTV